MKIDIIDYISKYIEETSFFNDQKKLDTIYDLMQGLTYRQIAEKIDSQASSVQSVVDFLDKSGLLYWGRWSPNVYKIGMRNSIAFLNWEDRDIPVKDNFEYTTYMYHVQAGEKKVFVTYTYPKEDELRINGDIGELITPFYHTRTRLTVPLFRKIYLKKEFFDIFESINNDKKVLIGTPSFESERIYDDPATVFICRYAQLLPELTPGILTEKLEQDFKGSAIEINFDQVKVTLERMKKEEVIFPRNPLYFEPLQYQSSIVRIRTKEIYKVMGTFSRFNMLTTLAFTRNPEIFYLYIQYPFYEFSDVMEILSQLDPTYIAYIATKFIMADTIYYQWSLERYLNPKSRV